MVLKLYAFPNSACGQRVAAALNEKEVPFELHVVEVAEIKTPEYLENQPFGQVPYIVRGLSNVFKNRADMVQDDDDFIIYESRAICRYIEAKYPRKGIKLAPSPEDSKACALFEQAASIEASNFNPYAENAVMEKWYKPYVVCNSKQGKSPSI